jgi:NADPH:quinone reductase-like Zn-dependent oxidoreductase
MRYLDLPVIAPGFDYRGIRMFAIYAAHSSMDDPLSALRIGDQPEPIIPKGFVRVRVTHASLNRHDLFTLRGITAHAEPIKFPMILGNDGAGTLDDGTPIVIYPVLGGEFWRGDETCDPDWHIFSEKVAGTFADYVVMPARNAIPLPPGISAADASVLGTAWLTAYRALFTKSNLRPGQRLLVQGASGGMSTALIQLGRAAGFEVWATSRNAKGKALAMKLGAHQVFDANEPLPQKVDAVVDSIGAASLTHSIVSTVRGGTVVITGVTTGMNVNIALLPVLSGQVNLRGSIMGTRDDMENMIHFLVHQGLKPEVGQILPMEQAASAFRNMWNGETHGKTLFTR